MRTVGQIGKRFRAGAEIFIIVAQLAGFADHADRETAATPALADAGVEHGRFVTRVGTNDQQGVGLFDAFNGGIEQIAGAAKRRVERCTILTAIDIGRTERSEQ
ncbi:hypothetical protein D3C78_1127940 [compost metagenome]